MENASSSVLGPQQPTPLPKGSLGAGIEGKVGFHGAELEGNVMIIYFALE